jgi:hypothetical protein
MKKNISPKFVKSLLNYDKETGVLTWKERGVELFNSERAMNSWNAKLAGEVAFTAKHREGYLHGKILGMGFLAHRIAWACHYGEWPTNEIDHVNGDRTDNRIENLRSCDRSENARNCAIRKDNTSGHVGVHFNKLHGTWNATSCGRHIGSYSTKEEAVAARKAAPEKYSLRHGEPDFDSIKMEPT